MEDEIEKPVTFYALYHGKSIIRHHLGEYFWNFLQPSDANLSSRDFVAGQNALDLPPGKVNVAPENRGKDRLPAINFQGLCFPSGSIGVFLLQVMNILFRQFI